MYIVTSELISVAYFINPSHQFVCLYMYPPIVARQRLGKTITVATNTRLAAAFCLLPWDGSCICLWFCCCVFNAFLVDWSVQALSITQEKYLNNNKIFNNK
jgi:hypothetical protein